MKNKGFTLIELLAVIAILAIIMLIATPRIMDAIEESRFNAFKNDEQIMTKAAETYLGNNENLIPSLNQSLSIPLTELKTGEYLIIKDECSGNVVLTNLPTGFSYTPYLNCDDYYSEDIIDEDLALDMPLGDYKTGEAFEDKTTNFQGTNGGTTLTTDHFGEADKASHFNSVDQEIALTASNSIITGNKFTISLWFNTEIITADEYNKRLITFHRVPTQSTGTALLVGLNDKLRFMYATSTGAHKYLDTVISTNQWYHAVGTYDGTTYKIYLNGELKNSVIDTFEGLDSGIAYIGAYGNDSNVFCGSIHDVKIYNRALTAEEIKLNYNIEVNNDEL